MEYLFIDFGHIQQYGSYTVRAGLGLAHTGDNRLSDWKCNALTYEILVWTHIKLMKRYNCGYRYI